MPQRDSERQAREFIEENESLLHGGSLPALERVVVRGAEIATALSGESAEAANLAASITRDLAAAITDRPTSPRRIEKLETDRAHARETYERKSAAFHEFDNFMQRAVEARRRKAGESEG